jgi:hypothetical protein
VYVLVGCRIVYAAASASQKTKSKPGDDDNVSKAKIVWQPAAPGVELVRKVVNENLRANLRAGFVCMYISYGLHRAMEVS